MDTNSKNDVWAGYFSRWNKEEDLYKFTSIYGWMPFSEKGFRITTQWIDSDDKKILEAGSGSGRFCIELARQNPKREIVGVDLSKKMLEISRRGVELRKLSNVSFLEADIFKLPFQNNSFDVVFNKGVIEHFDNYKDILEEMIRVTKHGGKVIVGVPNKNNVIHRLWYWYEKDVRKIYPYGMEILFTPKRLKDLFTAAGLINLEQDGYCVFYRLSKFTNSKNLLAKFIQRSLKLLAILFYYTLEKPFDKVTGHKFSKIFGWEVVMKGVKP